MRHTSNTIIREEEMVDAVRTCRRPCQVGRGGVRDESRTEHLRPTVGHLRGTV